MKYMGSKRTMLANGLGTLLKEHGQASNQIWDPFCGSSVVSWFFAQNTDRKVIASDLQEYATILAKAVLSRRTPLDTTELLSEWLSRARSHMRLHPYWGEAHAVRRLWVSKHPETYVEEARQLCDKTSVNNGLVWSAYGGYYFSPIQAIALDSLRVTLPSSEPDRAVATSALISAAYSCAASPGHTAQPFQPTENALPYIMASWDQRVFYWLEREIVDIASRFSNTLGEALVGDAFELLEEIEEGDLVFLDPPYSFAQYSRFYHVLETIARGHCGEISGAGRYPPSSERPRSQFSLKSQSEHALDRLLARIASKGASVVLTFPTGDCSNGLSGDSVFRIASMYFSVEDRIVEGLFSTLGGNGSVRPARRASQELILRLSPLG